MMAGKRSECAAMQPRSRGAACARLLLLLLVVAGPAWAAQPSATPQHVVSLSDIVAAVPADVDHMDVVRASRIWRKASGALLGSKRWNGAKPGWATLADWPWLSVAPGAFLPAHLASAGGAGAHALRRCRPSRPLFSSAAPHLWARGGIAMSRSPSTNCMRLPSPHPIVHSLTSQTEVQTLTPLHGPVAGRDQDICCGEHRALAGDYCRGFGQQ